MAGRTRSGTQRAPSVAASLSEMAASEADAFQADQLDLNLTERQNCGSIKIFNSVVATDQTQS